MIVRVRYGAAAVLAALIAMSGCSSDPGPTTTPRPASTPPASPSTPSPSTSPDPTAAASAAVLAAYLNFQHAVADAQRTANAHSKQLEKYAIDKALAQARVGLLQLSESNVVFRGDPRFDPTVTSLAVAATPRTAVVKDCVDSANWIPVNRATGKSVKAPGQHDRVVNVATLTDYPGHWVVRTLTIERNQTC